MKSTFKSALVSAIVLSPLWLPLGVWGEDFELEIGDPVAGELTQEALAHRYTFVAEAEQRLNAFVGSDDFDTVLSVLDQDGQELFSNDDALGYGLNSRVGPFVLPEAGEYTLVVESFSSRNSNGADGSTGNYQLILSEAEVVPLELGETVAGSLSAEMPFAFFSFESEESLPLLAELEAEFEGILLLQDQEGMPLTSSDFETFAQDQESNQDQEPITVMSTLPQASGLWMVGSLDGSSAGDFALTVESLPIRSIAVGEKLEGSVVGEMPIFYRFEAEANTIVDIRVAAEEEFDTTLALLDPEGFEFAFNDDAYGLDPALENLLLPVDGTYIAVVRSFLSDSETEGSFVISLAEGDVPDLRAGEQTASFSDQRRQALFKLEAEAGDLLQLSLEQVFEDDAEPDFRELSFALQQGQEIIANGFDSGRLVNRMVVIEIPADGTYYLQLNDASFFEDPELEWASTVTITLDTLETENAENDDAAESEESEDPMEEMTEETEAEASETETETPKRNSSPSN